MIDKRLVRRELRKAERAWILFLGSTFLSTLLFMGIVEVLYSNKGYAWMLGFFLMLLSAVMAFVGPRISDVDLADAAPFCFLPFQAKRLQSAYQGYTNLCSYVFESRFLQAGIIFDRFLLMSTDVWRQKLSRSVFEAVVAHELAHVALPPRSLFGIKFVTVLLGWHVGVAAGLSALVVMSTFFFYPIALLFPVIWVALRLPQWMERKAYHRIEFAADALGAWYIDSIEAMKDVLIIVAEQESRQRDKYIWIYGEDVLGDQMKKYGNHPSPHERIVALDRLQTQKPSTQE